MAFFALSKKIDFRWTLEKKIVNKNINCMYTKRKVRLCLRKQRSFKLYVGLAMYVFIWSSKNTEAEDRSVYNIYLTFSYSQGAVNLLTLNVNCKKNFHTSWLVIFIIYDGLFITEKLIKNLGCLYAQVGAVLKNSMQLLDCVHTV